MIILEEKLSAPTERGAFYMLHRWRCSACNRHGVWLLNAKEVAQHGATHASTHTTKETATP